MVESNITLETSIILSTLNNTNLEVTTATGTHQLTIQQMELSADCLVLGDSVTCDCGTGYIWSNEVCYNTTTCCNGTTCDQPITHFSPICIPKIQVQIVGTVTVLVPWDDVAEQKLITGMKTLNGLEYLNVTALESDLIADFEANVSALFTTAKLLEVLAALELDIGASITMDTIAPGSLVCYDSTPVLSCNFHEVTTLAVWSMSRGEEFSELGNGSVAQINNQCGTAELPGCLILTLIKVKGNWAGTFKCGFSEGSVRHTAQLDLTVALLPDTIEMLVTPLTVDCSELTPADNLKVKVTTIIPNSTEDFLVTWSYRGVMKGELQPVEFFDGLHFTMEPSISCTTSDLAHYINITFKNQKDQTKTTRMDFPVLYPGAPFCEEEVMDLAMWPRTPGGNTVYNRSCGEGRVGFASRTCEGKVWQEVFYQCVSKEMFDMLNNFKQGFGATQGAAEVIFGGLNNGSNKNSGSKEDLADLTASIDILNTMAQASGNIVLQDPILPNLIGAASNMLNQSWDAVNITIQNSMSSNYLESVEGLVHNIMANNSKGVDSENVQLNICDTLEEQSCATEVFGVDVNLNSSQGVIKTMAVKNLAEKLENNFKGSKTASLVVSATLQSSDSKQIKIQLDFPQEHPEYNKVLCVFWNITSHKWSDEGCQSITDKSGNRTICTCTHLTPFSALMSKNVLILPFLDEITYLGLGVSICALLLFLIIEALVWSAVVKSNLSHFRHTSLVNISISLLLADLCFLASAFPDKISDTMCLVFTICKHFFFLTMFCWMLCLSVMLVHQLIFVFSPLRKRVFMFLSSIVGYVVPMLIVGSTYVYYEYTGGEYLKMETCWLTYDGLLRGSIHAFLLPVAAVVLTNMFSMGVVILTLTKTAVPDDNKSDADTVKSILKVMLLLTPAFGVTWILGFVLLLLGDSDPDASTDGTKAPGFLIFINYAFTILNTFQGLFIFLAGVLAEQKVRQEVVKLILSKVRAGPVSGTSTHPDNIYH
ncbi:hypothetical protein NHX12_026191 [Muraenolepis orangiensis]|uniref:Adhesion G-protein coupled receptor F3-like n=1 Tax=Muraenolepis orangiensis TaxID=630683 RepID=A0A9Q0IN21_9TELE|nr:hypothetical protein NHX12_026191 [Muraenolepis orangiensis]